MEHLVGRAWIIAVGALTTAGTFALCGNAWAQNRGVYPLGMNATNSGVTPAPGFTYSNLFILYARDKSKGADGELLTTGSNSVLMDMNSLIWVSRKKILGATYSASATIPFANNSLSSNATGAISGGGGLADSYYQPVILGWRTERAGIRAIYGFLAPTGRFEFGADDNVGSGYWTHVLASGQTVYLTQDKRTAISAFQMYEWHTTQEGTGIHPGQTLSLDYSVTRMLPLGQDMTLQVGVVGYEQRQTTNKSGPGITQDQAEARYAVNALGFAGNLSLPERRVTLGLKYYKEFSNRSTFQGYALQISGSVAF
ncbi:MAG TPA: transporter [Gemmatimonadales bacterium]|nr:transporter [Gemmatimonadales bacterium]